MQSESVNRPPVQGLREAGLGGYEVALGGRGGVGLVRSFDILDALHGAHKPVPSHPATAKCMESGPRLTFVSHFYRAIPLLFETPGKEKIPAIFNLFRHDLLMFL